jgi:hypothetical protein
MIEWFMKHHCNYLFKEVFHFQIQKIYKKKWKNRRAKEEMPSTGRTKLGDSHA